MDDHTSPPDAQHATAHAYVGGRLDIQQVVEHYTAGKKSIVPIVIGNPFDRPIKLLDVILPTSTSVRAVTRRFENEVEKKKDSKIIRALRITAEVLGAVLSRVTFLGVEVFELERLAPESTGKTINIDAQAGSDVTYDIADRDISVINVSAQEGASVRINPVAQGAERKYHVIIIPAHCEIVETFTFRSGNSLLSQPITVNTNIQIDYELGNDRKTQVVPIAVTIRPSPLAIVAGAVLGSVTGSLAKGVNPFVKGNFLIAVAPIFMSIIAAIALSRKSGSQGVLTVEDFYGGFLIGALIGYGGSSEFESAMHPEMSSVIGKP